MAGSYVSRMDSHRPLSLIRIRDTALDIESHRRDRSTR